MLVTAHDLSAMGARPVGAMDTIGAADAAHAERIVRGLRAGSQAFDLPVLGGHTTLGVPGSLGVTGLGSTARPVPAGGGRPGDVLTLTADLGGGWRPGYRARQWDSTTGRTREELAAMLGAVARAQPRAAKDVSMAGTVGTAGMLAEASGCGVELDVGAVPRPRGVDAGDWLTCFPGFAMLTTDPAGAPPLAAGPAIGAAVGRLQTEPGVRLRWPDGDVTVAVAGAVTGLGPARRAAA
jgi:AIR synthase-related protein